MAAAEYNPPLMPTVEQRLQEDVKAAMKAGRKDELEVLRTLLSDVKNTAIAEGLERTGVPDEVVLRVLRKGVKTRSESLALYTEAGRTDLADKESFQIGVIERYMPAAASEADIEQAVDAVVAELGATDKKAMGAVMKEVMSRLGGAADGKQVSRVVASRLG